MKIGVIGIGHIAQKAYLPVLTQTKDIELHLCTRNENTLKEVGETYHLNNLYTDINEWIASGITAAFVHSSTDSHEYIIDLLLDHNIHVYVDKPVTNHLESTLRLIEKAKSKNLILMVGFNRRYAPSYNNLKEVANPNLMIMQKNVAKPVGDVRSFIFDDFIHVIDTIRYLFPYTINNVHVSSHKIKEALHHVVIKLEADEGTAIGIMNRNVGASLEKIELMGAQETRIAMNVNEVISHTSQGLLTYPEDNWQPTLKKRGFHDIIAHFLALIKQDTVSYEQNESDIETHRLAEQVVQLINS